MPGEATAAKVAMKLGSKALLKKLLGAGASIGASTIIGGPVGGVIDAVLMASTLKDIWDLSRGNVVSPAAGAEKFAAAKAMAGGGPTTVEELARLAPKAGILGRTFKLAGAHPIITALLAGQVGNMLRGGQEPTPEDAATQQARMLAEGSGGATMQDDPKAVMQQLQMMLMMQKLQRGGGQAPAPGVSQNPFGAVPL